MPLSLNLHVLDSRTPPVTSGRVCPAKAQRKCTKWNIHTAVAIYSKYNTETNNSGGGDLYNHSVRREMIMIAQ